MLTNSYDETKLDAAIIICDERLDNSEDAFKHFFLDMNKRKIPIVYINDNYNSLDLVELNNNNIKFWHPLSNKYFFNIYPRNKKIDIPVIVMCHTILDELLTLTIKLYTKFTSDDYSALCFANTTIGILQHFNYILSKKAGMILKEIKQEYFINNPDLILCSLYDIGKKRISKICKGLKADFLILPDKYKNTTKDYNKCAEKIIFFSKGENTELYDKIIQHFNNHPN